MADGAVNFLPEKVTMILRQEASLLGDSQSDVEAIHQDLNIMKCCMRDAEIKSFKSPLVETWVRQVSEVVNKIEGVLDEYAYYKYMEAERKNLVQDMIKVPMHMTRRRKMSLKLQKLKAEIGEVFERRKRFTFDLQMRDEIRGVRNDPVHCWQRQEELSVSVDEDEIVGMGDNKDQLLKWLMDGDTKPMVISVVGMGGLGKTTLVTKVYNDQMIRQYFDCWAWVSVSQTNEVEELLRSMIKQLYRAKNKSVPSDLVSKTYKDLGDMLIAYLSNKRYIIVLDDVWNILLWSRIRSAFRDNGHGSRVIFTTRQDNVANSVGRGKHILHLDPLGEDDSWALFCKKAFWSEPGHFCPVELIELAQAITRKCEGLPLAIVAIGGLLCPRNQTVLEWKKIYDSLNWELSNNPLLESVKGILSLSYNDLPSHLKHCFLYCCVFHNGYPIKKKKLIRLWVAEGFTSKQAGLTMEEVAENYLMELSLQSMIQVTKTNDFGRLKTFRVHDVMRELAMTTSGKANFCSTYDDKEAITEGKLQRLSVYNRGETVRWSWSRHLRAFFVFQIETKSSFTIDVIMSRFKLLKVLDLEAVSVGAIPNSVGDLFNLRFLNLQGTNISELPQSIQMLRNLQTLDVRNTHLTKLPNGILVIPRLRHLLLGLSKASTIHSGFRVPTQITQIQSLQTLASIEAEEELIHKVGNLTELKRLDITKLKANDGPKLCTSVKEMRHLRCLSITASTESEELVLETLSHTPLYLQKLALVGKLSKLPPWLESLSNLTHLYLRCSNLGEDIDILSSIQKLPILACLELKNACNRRFLHFRAGGFNKLNKMLLMDLAALFSLRFEKGTLPSIKELNLVRFLETSSTLQGIQHLTSLQKLHLEEMPAELVEKLRGDERTNVQHINTIGILYRTGQGQVIETLF
ncbi:disease resistance protein RPM1-like [Bidens hawaiensis]|uniref:disease resistance protein RPM1-like n=1 Tax=Bidens hawaiensis TaxID=980011 RepID=UPI00404B831E